LALTTAQLTKLDRSRKEKPPSYYASATQTYTSVGGATEDALILTSSETKQQAVKYLDALIDASRSATDGDAITERAAKQWRENIDGALAEITPVIQQFERFRETLAGKGSTEPVFAVGLQPLLKSVNGGISPIRLQIGSLRYFRKFSLFAAKLYSSELTDEQKKEWRSWKRVLLSYP